MLWSSRLIAMLLWGTLIHDFTYLLTDWLTYLLNAILSYVLLLTGIGLGMVIITFLCSVYYNVIMAWTFYYLFASFQKHLPWESCGKEWNTDLCKYVKHVLLYNVHVIEKQTSCKRNNGSKPWPNCCNLFPVNWINWVAPKWSFVHNFVI